jgi:hypothetical protein
MSNISGALGMALAIVVLSCGSALAEPGDERSAWKANIARAKVRAAERRIEAINEQRRLQQEAARSGPISHELRRARLNSEAVLNDSSLQRGDIVSTVDGMFVYIGTGSSRSPDDFVPFPGYTPR